MVPDMDKKEACFTYDGSAEYAYTPQYPDVTWIAHPTDESKDGYYYQQNNDGIAIVDVSTNSSQTLASFKDLDAANGGEKFSFSSFTLSPDWKYILFQLSDQIVHQYHVSEYYVFDIETKKLLPLNGKEGNQLQYAEWGPKGHRVGFVKDNDVYVSDTKSIIRVTSNGGDDVYNGIWNKEIGGFTTPGYTKIRWSPDGEAIAYISVDTSKAPKMSIPMYHSDNYTLGHPEDIKYAYVTPGSAKDVSSLYVYRLDFNSTKQEPGQSYIDVSKHSDNSKKPALVKFADPRFEDCDTLIFSVTWVTEVHSNFIVDVYNRVQDHKRVYLADYDSLDSKSNTIMAKMVREWDTNDKGGDGAWIETTDSITYIKKDLVPGLPEGYIDIVQNGDNLHFGFFSPLSAKSPKAYLTSGKWDVIDQKFRLDSKNGMFYYSTRGTIGMMKNGYSVNLADLVKNNSSNAESTPKSELITSSSGWSLIDQDLKSHASTNGTYSWDISTGGSYIHIFYDGPDLPWSVARRIDPSTHKIDPNFELVTSKNIELQESYKSCALPTTRFFTIKSGEYDLNAKMILPPDFKDDGSKKYGVVFDVYGGPAAQQAYPEYNIDWDHALASQQDVEDMQFIVLSVDNRGTPAKGRKFLTAISKQFGVPEVQDQIEVAKYMKSLPYVNPDRIAMWGWSHGGYMTLRCLEAAPEIFKIGMAVAPVTNWYKYNAGYTEVYMKAPEMNPQGYNNTRVTNFASFNKTKLLIQYGTADDNVTPQNTLTFIAGLQEAGVRSFETAEYPDADHSISAHNATPLLYDRLRKFLFRSFREIEAEKESK